MEVKNVKAGTFVQVPGAGFNRRGIFLACTPEEEQSMNYKESEVLAMQFADLLRRVAEDIRNGKHPGSNLLHPQGGGRIVLNG